MARYMNGVALLLSYAFVTAGADTECEAKQGDLNDAVGMLQARSTVKIHGIQQVNQPACSREVSAMIDMFKMVPGTPANLSFVNFQGLRNFPSTNNLNVVDLALEVAGCTAAANLSCALSAANWISDACSSCIHGNDPKDCIPSLLPQEGLPHPGYIPPELDTQYHTAGLLLAYQNLTQALASHQIAAASNATCNAASVFSGSSVTTPCQHCLSRAQEVLTGINCNPRCEAWFYQTVAEETTNSTPGATCATCLAAGMAFPLDCLGVTDGELTARLLVFGMATMKFTKDMSMTAAVV